MMCVDQPPSTKIVCPFMYARVVGSQERHRRGDIGWLAETRRQHIAQALLAVLLSRTGDGRPGLDGARGHGIAPDVALSILDGQKSGQGVKGGLAGRVDRQPPLAEVGGCGRGVDDGPSTPFQHPRNAIFERKHRTKDIDGHGPGEHLQLEIHQVAIAIEKVGGKEGGVVVQDVEAAERVDCCADHLFDRSLVGDIDLQRDRLAAGSLGLVCHRFRRRTIDVDDANRGSLRGKPQDR